MAVSHGKNSQSEWSSLIGQLGSLFSFSLGTWNCILEHLELNSIQFYLDMWHLDGGSNSVGWSQVYFDTYMQLL